jgi:hypothetical protein
METFNRIFRLGPTVLISLLFLQAGVYAQQLVVVDTDFLQEINPNTGVLSVQQISFVFDSGRVLDSDWGQIQVDPAQFGNITGLNSGYINLFIQSNEAPTSTAPPDPTLKWVIHNLLVPEILVDDCPPSGNNDNSDSTGGPPTSTPPANGPTTGPVDLSPAVVRNPISTYFDLRPTTDGTGRLDFIMGTIIVSEQPLPDLENILDIAGTYNPQVIRVQQDIVNAEGHFWAQTDSISVVIQAEGPALIGPPPLPPDPSPDFPGDLAFPIEIFQSDQPNVQCAKNQCVPMAHANVLGYLQQRYDGSPLVWNLPHDFIPGIGKISSSGDILNWFPEPENSLVANVDALTRRLGVINAAVGEGSSECQLIRGPFGYMAAYGDSAKVVFRHQGGELLYGDGQECDNGTVILGGIVSAREGLFPTWQWMFEQLQLGRGVSMLFGRYDINGERTSGHMVRVWGVASYNNKDYIYTLDDGNQGINSTGLRTQQWEVEDIGQPGLAGIPDGRLNMNGTTWEIELAISAEAKPTLAIP